MYACLSHSHFWESISYKYDCLFVFTISIAMPNYPLVGVNGSPSPSARIFGGTMPYKTRPAFCVWNPSSTSTVWLSYKGRDVPMLHDHVANNGGLNNVLVSFECDITKLPGDGTYSNMKELPTIENLKFAHAKVSNDLTEGTLT